ncbi:MAG TPA: ankyrin repeat domain-containing protein [Spirochaetota bacterium]
MKQIITLILLIALGSVAEAKSEGGDLFTAVERGDVKLVERILGKGANINAKDHEGRTALHLAVITRNTAMLKFILSKNPDINAEDDMLGATPLALAASKRFTDGVRLILEHNPSLDKGTSSMPLSFIATDSDDPEILSLLTKAGMNLTVMINNYEFANNVTCLMYAITTGRTESVKFLLSRDADINFPDSNGDPAIIWALFYDKTDIAKILIESGKKINYRTTGTGAPKGALDLAERKGFDEIADLIRKKDGQSD